MEDESNTFTVQAASGAAAPASGLQDWMSSNFGWVQGGVILGFVLLAWLVFRPQSPDSGFKVREADLRDPKKRDPSARAKPGDDALAQSRMKPKSPLALTGIRLDLPPHELLGVRESASPTEIQRAYRDLMKRYHPDRVAAPDTPQWHEAQKIAEAINQAKETLIAKSKR